jgi:hypothetical protein
MFKKLQVALIRRFARKRLGKDIAPLETIAIHPTFSSLIQSSAWRWRKLILSRQS